MMKTQGQIEIDNNKARNEMHLQNMKGEQDLIKESMKSNTSNL